MYSPALGFASSGIVAGSMAATMMSARAKAGFIGYTMASTIGILQGAGAKPGFATITTCMYVGFKLGSALEDYITEELIRLGLIKKRSDWQFVFDNSEV